MTLEIPAPVLADHRTSLDERALAVRDTLTQPRKVKQPLYFRWIAMEHCDPLFGRERTYLSTANPSLRHMRQSGGDEAFEERMRGARAGAELGMELAGDEPRVRAQLDDFGQRAVG